MTPDVLLFDLDDTLIDYSSRVAPCWDAACALAGDAGLDPTRVAEAVHVSRRWFWGDPVRHARERVHMLAAWTRIVERALAELASPVPGLAATIAADFAARRRDATTIFPDTLPCLRALRAAGVTLGLVTNGDAEMQREKIARFALAGWFDAIVIEGEFGTGKPDPRIYAHALATLDAAPARAMMVGDNLEWDVAGAQRAGLGGVWIDRAGRGLPADDLVVPTRIIDGLARLVEPAGV